MTAMFRSRGFTLIELLVVIAIIGTLASVVLASLNNARVKARDAKRQSDMETIRTALEMYYTAHGQFPAEVAGGASCWGPWQSGNANGGSSAWLDKLVADGDLTKAPVEDTLTGCVYRYMRISGPTACGSTDGNYGVLYWETENPRPANSPFVQPACWASMSWYEAGPTDPNGNLMILPE